MRKIICILLILPLMFTVFSGHTKAKSNNDIFLPDISDISGIEDDFSATYIFPDKTLVFSSDDIGREGLEFLLGIFCSENLVSLNENTENDSDDSKKLGSFCFAFENKYYSFIFSNDYGVLVDIKNNENETSANCRFKFKNSSVYWNTVGFFEELTTKKYGVEDETPEPDKPEDSEGTKPPEEPEKSEIKRENSIEISDFSIIYTCPLPLTDYVDFHSLRWGVCSYTRKGEAQPVTVMFFSRYMTDSKMVCTISEEISENNTVTFNHKRTLSVNPQTKTGEEFDSKENSFIIDFIIQVNVSENMQSEKLTVTEKHKPSSTTRTTVINALQTEQSGKLPGDLFDIRNNIDYTDDENNSSSDGNLISKITEHNATLYSIMFNYNADGDKVNILKVWHELEDDEIYDDVKEIWNKATFLYTDKISDKSSSDLTISFSKANGYHIYAEIFDGYIKIYNNETEKNPEYYSYTGTNLYGKYTEIFKRYVDYELENFIRYEDISNFNPKYTYSFQITLPDVLKNSWIDEVSENGKVKITVFHKSNSDVSHITLEGNSKSYSLMRDYFLPANYLTGENTTPSFTTDIIGIDKDTPIPHHFDEGGAIVLSWSTCTQYEKNDNLTVDIYAKKDASKRFSEANVDYKSPTANDVAVIKLTEALTEDDFLETPIEPKAERGLIFDDVPENHWAHKTIENFYYATIVRGVGNRLFAPDDSITYEHFGFLLNRLFGYKYENTTKVPALRQDVITALVKACGIDESGADEASILDKFSDKDMINPENLPYVQKAVEDGLVIGYGGALNANGYLTRAETVTLLYRALKNVYGVTDNDIAENYKLKVIPKNSKYMSVRGIEPFRFYIKNNGGDDSESKYIVYSTNSERLNGELLITFGDDVYEDTNIYAVCLIDGNCYVIESTSVYSALFRDTKKLMFYANVYKNGELIIENAKTTLYYSPQDDDVEFYGDGAGLYFFSAQASNGRLPEAPDKVGIVDENYEKFKNGKEILASGTLENVRGDNFISDMHTLSTGFMKIMYSPDWSAVDLSEIQITSKSLTLGNHEYIIKPVELISYNSFEITGLFNIYRDNEVISEKLPGKITGINSGLGKYIVFTTDDNTWNFEIQISEIVN